MLFYISIFIFLFFFCFMIYIIYNTLHVRLSCNVNKDKEKFFTRKVSRVWGGSLFRINDRGSENAAKIHNASMSEDLPYRHSDVSDWIKFLIECFRDIRYAHDGFSRRREREERERGRERGDFSNVKYFTIRRRGSRPFSSYSWGKLIKGSLRKNMEDGGVDS